MEYGWIMLLILAVMGSVIAYLGDKIGSRVGKRKIKLFGMRPKYSSILITIITGVSIAAVTLGVMSVLSKNVRIALFGIIRPQTRKPNWNSNGTGCWNRPGHWDWKWKKRTTCWYANRNLLRHQEQRQPIPTTTSERHSWICETGQPAMM